MSAQTLPVEFFSSVAPHPDSLASVLIMKSTSDWWMLASALSMTWTRYLNSSIIYWMRFILFAKCSFALLGEQIFSLSTEG